MPWLCEVLGTVVDTPTLATSPPCQLNKLVDYHTLGEAADEPCAPAAAYKRR